VSVRRPRIEGTPPRTRQNAEHAVSAPGQRV
jgi:hypothetical protein